MMTMIDDMMGMMIMMAMKSKMSGVVVTQKGPKSTRMLQKLPTSTNTSKKCVGLSECIKVVYGIW